METVQKCMALQQNCKLCICRSNIQFGIHYEHTFITNQRNTVGTTATGHKV